MALSIKDPEAERLAAEVASLSGESKTQAVRTALRERRDRLVLREGAVDRPGAIMRVLTDEIWPQIPDHVLEAGLSRQEREAILGYGPGGV